MSTSFLSDQDIGKLSRGLQILIATDGTLTRILNVIGNDEVVVRVVKQQIHDRVASEISGVTDLSGNRILQRQVLLSGRNSEAAFVAAESLLAIDFLPRAIVKSLMETDRPLGEVMIASRLETFKEPARVWMGEAPAWAVPTPDQNARSDTVARRYRVFVAGQPLIIITEYFLYAMLLDSSELYDDPIRRESR